MFVLIVGVTVLALITKYGPSILPNKKQWQKFDNGVDWLLFVVIAIFLVGLMGGGE